MPTYRKGKADWIDPTLLAERVDYNEYSVRATEEVRRLLSVMRGGLEHIRAPVLLVHSRRDENVPAINMDEIYAGLQTDKKREWVDLGSHNIVGDADRDSVAVLAADFIAQVAS